MVEMTGIGKGMRNLVEVGPAENPLCLDFLDKFLRPLVDLRLATCR